MVGFFVIVAWTGYYLYGTAIDAHHYGFFETGLSNARDNFLRHNGRWAQGFTNDHRFYTHRFWSTLGINLLLFSSLWYFFHGILKKYSFAIATLVLLAIHLNVFNVYQVSYLLNTALSYTLGIALLLFFYGAMIRSSSKGFLTDHRTWLGILIIAFLTGLVEHLFLLNILLLGFLMFLKVIQRQWSWRLLLFLLINGIGAVVTLRSPGLVKRRELTAIRNEQAGGDGSISWEEFWASLGHHLELNLNGTLLIVFVIGVLLAIHPSPLRKPPKWSKTSRILLVLFCLILPVFPILLGYVGTNGLVDMTKAYNLFAILILGATMMISFLLGSLLAGKGRFSAPQWLVAVGIMIGLLWTTSAFFIPNGNHLHFQKAQLTTGQLQEAYWEEFARRQYLIETFHQYKPKTIPSLSLSYKGKVYGAQRGNKTPKYYNRRFNNSIPIVVSDQLPPPRAYTAMFLVANERLQPLYSQDGITVYLDGRLKVLVFQMDCETPCLEAVKNMPISVESSVGFKTGEQRLDVNEPRGMEFYQKYPKYWSVELPIGTTSVTLTDWGTSYELTDPELADKLMAKADYGNIMR